MTVQYVIDFGFVDISCLVISGQAKAMPVWRVLKVTHRGGQNWRRSLRSTIACLLLILLYCACAVTCENVHQSSADVLLSKLLEEDNQQGSRLTQSQPKLRLKMFYQTYTACKLP